MWCDVILEMCCGVVCMTVYVSSKSLWLSHLHILCLLLDGLVTVYSCDVHYDAHILLTSRAFDPVGSLLRENRECACGAISVC